MVDDMDINELTRVQTLDNIFLKREDEFTICGVSGGKARAAYQLIQNGIKNGYNTFCTAGSRMSPQCEIVSYICNYFKVTCHLFMPSGRNTSVIDNIQSNETSFIHRAKVGYNSVLIHNAKEFAANNHHCYIPFGMECLENIEVTKHQVKNIPKCIKRIIIPCGSGMSMISVIKGLEYYNMQETEVIGVIVGKKPQKTFEKFIGNNLFNKSIIRYSFVNSLIEYHKSPKITSISGVDLDPIYESKCLPFLQKGDLLWIVGHRK